MIVEDERSRMSLTVIPGMMTGHVTGMRATMKVGMAKASVKRKVLRHLRMVLLWLMLERLPPGPVHT